MVLRLGQFCLIALLLVPVVFGAHRHADLVGSRDCAVCVVVHHGPLAPASVLAIDALHVSIPIAPVAVGAPVAVAGVRQLGRAPPAVLPPSAI